MEKLSESEEMVMRCLWESDRPLGLSEVITACQSYERGWKPQTVSTFLSRLVQKGYVDTRKRNRGNVYFPRIEQEAYLNDQMQAMLDFWGKPSIRALASAFGRSQAIGPEDLRELRAMLDDLDE